MAIEPITTHVADALLLPLGSYRGKPRFEALLSSYVKEVQKLEDATWTVILGRLLDDAVGVQLDALGRLVGRDRAGMDDDTYRLWLNVQIRINISEGHPDDIIRVVSLVEDEFRFLEYFPASFDIEFDETPTVDPFILAEMVGETRGAGVDGAVVVSPAPFADSILGAYEEDEASDEQGGADEAETVGGVGANVYR